MAAACPWRPLVHGGCSERKFFIWLSNRAMMMITNEPGHVVVRQLWMGFEIVGDFYSIGVTFPGQ